MIQRIPAILVRWVHRFRLPPRLIFVTHRDDIPAIPARRGRQPVALVGGAGAAPEVRH